MPDTQSSSPAAAPARTTPGHAAPRERRDRDRGPGKRARRVTTGQGAAMASASANMPRRERREPGLVGTRQRNRQEEATRLRAAGRQIREIHRQRLVAEGLRSTPVRKCTPSTSMSW